MDVATASYHSLCRFTSAKRPLVIHIRRVSDVVPPEVASFPLRQSLVVYGAVSDRTLPSLGVATGDDTWCIVEKVNDDLDDVCIADGVWNKNAASFDYADTLDNVMALDGDVDNPIVDDAEAAPQGPAVDYPLVNADRRDEEAFQETVASEVHVAPGGVLPSGIASLRTQGRYDWLAPRRGVCGRRPASLNFGY